MTNEERRKEESTHYYTYNIAMLKSNDINKKKFSIAWQSHLSIVVTLNSLIPFITMLISHLISINFVLCIQIMIKKRSTIIAATTNGSTNLFSYNEKGLKNGL